MGEAIKQLFTQISPTYDRLNHLLSFNSDRLWRRSALRLLEAEPDEPLQILDVCAGTLDLAIAAVRRFPASHVTALDFSQGMLDIGRKKVRSLGFEDRIEAVFGDAHRLPFSDASFDVVMCAYGVRNLEDLRQGLAEFRRVLRPGGTLLVLEFFRPTHLLTRVFNHTYGEFVLPLIGRLVSGHAHAYKYLRDSIRGFLSVAAFCELLSTCGFDHARARDFSLAISSVVTAKRDQR